MQTKASKSLECPQTLGDRRVFSGFLCNLEDSSGDWHAPVQVSHLSVTSKSHKEILKAQKGTLSQAFLQENVHFGSGFKVNDYPVRIFCISLFFIAINSPYFYLLIKITIEPITVIYVEMHLEEKH